MTTNITDLDRELSITPVLRMPFRAFFLGAAGFSCIALIIWLASFLLGFKVGGADLYWHIHEMIFGFAATTVLGFVLTAGQTWTGVPTVRGASLGALVGIWLLARITWLLPSPYQWLGSLADALLFILAAGIIGRMVLRSRNWRNAFFAPLFLAVAGISVAYGLLIKQGDTATAHRLLVVVLLLIVHVVLVIGGRVIPFFSDRRLKRADTTPLPWLEYCALGASLLFIGTVAFTPDGVLMGFAAIPVALFNLLRWLRWKPWQTAGIPLLWSLYVAYLFIIGGFVAMALGATLSVALHLLAVGGIGLMILAMISRVCLGHSGRPLELPRGFTVAYTALIGATLTRAAAGMLPAMYTPLLWASGICWLLGFGLFLYHYTPILITARTDGRPG